MKFLFITTYDSGGAGVAALRLHYSLLENGHQSAVLVKEKSTEDKTVFALQDIIGRSKLSDLKSRTLNKIRSFLPRENITDPNYCFYTLDEREHTIDFSGHINKFPFIPDVIISCWTSTFLNFQSLSSLQFNTKARLFWWGFDMSPLTGGCHYAWGCTGYTKDCSFCPAIIEDEYKENPFRNLSMRKHYIDESGLLFIAGSDSLYNQAKRSFLFHAQKDIPKVLMCIDERIYNNDNRSVAKSYYHILPHQKVIFYGSTFTLEKRKGIKYFVEALKKLHVMLMENHREDLEQSIVVYLVGKQLLASEYATEIPFQVRYLDFVKGDDQLARLYKASDVFVCTSVEDSGPMMINESVMCGTPVVSFNIGITADLIENGKSGYISTLYNTDQISDGIYKIITLSDEEYKNLSDTTASIGLERTSRNVVVKSFLDAIENLKN